MPDNDEAARVARAKALREQIERINQAPRDAGAVSKPPPTGSPVTSLQPPAPKSPREFVEGKKRVPKGKKP